jgi:hypothetical protein
LGHSISFERDTETGAEISVWQCGHMRTATVHLHERAPTIVESKPGTNQKIIILSCFS